MVLRWLTVRAVSTISEVVKKAGIVSVARTIPLQNHREPAHGARDKFTSSQTIRPPLLSPN
jgi:hypothetical protein